MYTNYNRHIKSNIGAPFFFFFANSSAEIYRILQLYASSEGAGSLKHNNHLQENLESDWLRN